MLAARSAVQAVVASKIRERFGGRMRLFVSGGAPLSTKIAYFFETLGFTILEGYGLTETSAASFVNRPGQVKIGTVGPAIDGTQVKIAEDGEVLIKGPGVMKGYYKVLGALAGGDDLEAGGATPVDQLADQRRLVAVSEE